jgi:hydrogenase maturation factor
VRQFQIALRYLRQYSNRTDEEKTELNAEKTADATAENAGMVIMETEIGTQTVLPQPKGELLPRIC